MKLICWLFGHRVWMTCEGDGWCACGARVSWQEGIRRGTHWTIGKGWRP